MMSGKPMSLPPMETSHGVDLPVTDEEAGVVDLGRHVADVVTAGRLRVGVGAQDVFDRGAGAREVDEGDRSPGIGLLEGERGLRLAGVGGAVADLILPDRLELLVDSPQHFRQRVREHGCGIAVRDGHLDKIRDLDEGHRT